MRKIISLILAVLMVSMMIPAMALAEESATTAVDYAGLVAGETFTVRVEDVVSTTVKIAVNSQLFSIDGGTIEGSVSYINATASENTATATVKVNASVPAVVESSRIQITDGETVTYQTASIADRLKGDVNGDEKFDENDATQILRKLVGYDVDEAFKLDVANVNLDDKVDENDATQILRKLVGYEVVDAKLGVDMRGKGDNDSIKVEDPFVDAPAVKKLATPDKIYAYAQNGKIYYTFDAVENATAYVIKTGDTTIATPAEATGSFAYDSFVAGMKITVTATADGYTASDASAEIEVIEADASGALAEWLTENGLEDVAITVHEIK